MVATSGVVFILQDHRSITNDVEESQIILLAFLSCDDLRIDRCEIHESSSVV